MSQSRARKPHSVGVECPKGRPTTVKASGDSAPCPPKQHRSNKIPKSIRYDLDNALVGLCDVWFEDIKPHLVRNKIKLHVESGAAAKGDCGRLPRAAPGCSHLDPASSASVCELCRLLFNAAQSIETAVSQAASAAPSAVPSTSSVLVSDTCPLDVSVTFSSSSSKD